MTIYKAMIFKDAGSSEGMPMAKSGLSDVKVQNDRIQSME